MGFSYSSKLGDGTGIGDDGFSYSPVTDTLDVGTLTANNVVVTALATPTVTSVTPTLTQVGTINVVAGASLADGDYFTINYGSGTIPIEFEATPPNGTTGGRIPFTFAAGDAAGTIRDGLIALINLAAPTKVVASIGGAAAITVSMVTPGEAGGVITENVANAGFTVAGFSNPTAATTYGYKAVSYLADGTSTAASAEVTTAAGHATLSASNYNTVVFAPSAGSTYTRLYRTTGGTAPPKLIYTGTATSYVDTGAAGTAQTPATSNGTGLVTAPLIEAASVRIGGPTVAGVSMVSANNVGLMVSSGDGGGYRGFAGSLLSLTATGPLGWVASGAPSGTPDTILSRGANPATLQLGAANAASPVAQTLQAQGSRGGTDTDVAGAALTIRPGAGTGAATGSLLVFQTPEVTSSGTTAQTQTTRLQIGAGGIFPYRNIRPGITNTYSLGTSSELFTNVHAREVTTYPGTGTASARASGVLHVSTTAQATTGTSEEILATYTMPANTLARDGQAVRITVYGATAANGNSKIARVRFGGIAGTTVATHTMTTNDGGWRAVAEIVRTGAATQVASGTAGSASAHTTAYTPPAQTLSGAVDVVVTGTTATAAGDLIFKALLVEALN